jgi:hypothetical protein
VTLGILELLSPNITNFAAGPYAPLNEASNSSGTGGDSLLGLGFDPDAEQAGLANQLLDDPTEAAAEPTATEFIPATPVPFVSGAELASETTAAPGPRSAATAGTSPTKAATVVPGTPAPGSATGPAAAPTEGTTTSGSDASNDNQDDDRPAPSNPAASTIPAPTSSATGANPLASS